MSKEIIKITIVRIPRHHDAEQISYHCFTQMRWKLIQMVFYGVIHTYTILQRYNGVTNCLFKIAMPHL